MNPGNSLHLPERDWETITDTIIKFIRDQVTHHGVVVGISGGLDSAVVSMLLSRSVKSGHVRGFYLSERDSPQESLGHARDAAGAAEIPLEEIDLTPSLEKMGCYAGITSSLSRFSAVNRMVYWGIHTLFRGDPYRSTLEGTDSKVFRQSIAHFRLKHRLRMAVLYQHAEKKGCLVAGCLNLTELLTGLFVPYGDNAADFAPILPLYKSEVQHIAEYLKIPRHIIDKAPSPDLLPGIDDATALGMAYPQLDRVLYALIKGIPEKDISSLIGITISEVQRIAGIVRISRRMRLPVVHPDLFGNDLPDVPNTV